MLIQLSPVVYPLKLFVDSLKDASLLPEMVDHGAELSVGSQGTVEAN